MSPGTAVLVDDLVVRFGDVEAVRGVSFAVEAGESFGLLGPNGAGKTTTIRILTTPLGPTGGVPSSAGTTSCATACRYAGCSATSRRRSRSTAP